MWAKWIPRLHTCTRGSQQQRTPAPPMSIRTRTAPWACEDEPSLLVPGGVCHIVNSYLTQCWPCRGKITSLATCVFCFSLLGVHRWQKEGMGVGCQSRGVPCERGQNKQEKGWPHPSSSHSDSKPILRQTCACAIFHSHRPLDSSPRPPRWPPPPRLGRQDAP